MTSTLFGDKLVNADGFTIAFKALNRLLPLDIDLSDTYSLDIEHFYP